MAARDGRTNAAGPPGHPVIGHLRQFSRDPLGFLTACARNYGTAVPLRFLHIPALLLLDPADIERVLVIEHRDFVKPAWLRTAAVRRLLGEGLVTSDGDIWRRQRHAAGPAFHPRCNASYGTTIAAIVGRRMAGWSAGDVIDLQREMSLLTLEVVAQALFRAEAPDWTIPAADAMDTLMARFASGAGLYGMAPIPPGFAEMRAAQRLDRIADALIDAGHKSTKSPDEPNLLAMLSCPITRGSATADARESGCSGAADDVTEHEAGAEVKGAPNSVSANPHPGEHVPRSARALRGHVKTFLGAGYESSALTLTWAFLMLSQRPELDAALAEEVTVRPEPLTAECAAGLSLTGAIVKETLRLFPPLWMTGREAARACEISGIAVRAGTLVMTSQWAVHRRPALYACPDAFLPERWMDGSAANLPRFAYFPFGGGPRVCIGQSFAMMETALLLASIARRFRLVPLGGGDFRPWATMTLRPPPGIRVRLEAR